MSVLNEPVLILGKSWLPVGTWTVANTFSHVFADKAKIVDATSGSWQTYDFLAWSELDPIPDAPCIRTAHLYIRLPEVAILTSEGRFKRDKIAFSKRNLLKRDRFTCSYCGKQGINCLTIDHVIPRSKNGKSNFLNCVSSCYECNAKKANKTLQESGLKLRIKPHEPTWSPIFKIPEHKYKKIWEAFLPQKVLSK